jgi:hypothetical protein
MECDVVVHDRASPESELQDREQAQPFRLVYTPFL